MFHFNPITITIRIFFIFYSDSNDSDSVDSDSVDSFFHPNLCYRHHEGALVSIIIQHASSNFRSSPGPGPPKGYIHCAAPKKLMLDLSQHSTLDKSVVKGDLIFNQLIYC